MARLNHNLYLSYKQDTNLLLYWIIRKSNNVIKSLPADGDNKAELQLNFTGQTTVSGLLSMSKLIAASISGSTVPDAVYRLFKSVIDKRTTVWQAFQSMVVANPDPDVEKSNLSHKFFIDTLQESFDALGGRQWASTQSATNPANGIDDEYEIKHALFTNQFSSLRVDGDPQDPDQSEGEDEYDAAPKTSSAPPQRRQQRRPGKGKKGKKKAAKKQPKTPHVREADLEDIPLESYRIIESEDGIITEYLMAVYALIQEWSDLRNHLQDVWMDVAYNNLNGAVAGTLSNIAVAMLKRSELAIFAHFPGGHDSYETVMKTITRGDPDKAQTMFSLNLMKFEPDGTAKKEKEVHVDVKEIFLINVYQDFMDFVNDFRQNRNGKPTKAMAAKTGNWDPKFDLRRATNEQRLQWRRAYTINWLYDLVNVYSSIVVQRNTLKGQNWDLSRVDWSKDGPWAQHIRLFGLNDFAGFVCSLAWQKQGVDVSKKVLPSHMLQLQAIVDSMTISRGWSISALQGHTLRSPAVGFRPRRDVDLFLDRECKRQGHGFLQGAHIFAQFVEKSDDPLHPKDIGLIAKLMMDEFNDWLGESKYMYGLNTIPPSRFSSTTANGLWEYSPFLCGVGLVEGLDLAYRLGMSIWDRLPEPILAVQLHNMLVQKGYITRPVGLYGTLAQLFPECLFTNGQEPKADFGAALLSRMGEITRGMRQRRAQAREIAQSKTNDLRKMLGVEYNNFFTTKSNLGLYHDANGHVEDIPEKDITPFSLLASIRLSQVRQYKDETGQRRLEETELVRQHLAHSMGPDDAKKTTKMADLINLVDKWRQTVSALEGPMQAGNMSPEMKAMLRESMGPQYAGYALGGDLQERLKKTSVSGGNQLGAFWKGSKLLEALRFDIYQDVCGAHPVSSFSYIWAVVVFFFLFSKMKEELQAANNKIYRRAFETDMEWQRAPLVGLVFLAMETQDEECLKIMARVFQDPRAGFMDNIYWEDLDPEMNGLESKVARSPAESSCVVM